MSQNGVLKISRKGKLKFTFDDEVVFEVDVIGVHDEWWQIDQTFRDEKNEIPAGQIVVYNQSRLQFIQAIVNAAYEAVGKQPPQLTHVEASEIMAKVTEKVLELRDFFLPKLPEQRFSAENMEVRFSQ